MERDFIVRRVGGRKVNRGFGRLLGEVGRDETDGNVDGVKTNSTCYITHLFLDFSRFARAQSLGGESDLFYYFCFVQSLYVNI